MKTAMNECKEGNAFSLLKNARRKE